MFVPTVAWAKVNVGEPVNVVSSLACTSDNPALAGTVT